jgi:hypothetical protein
MPIEMIRSDSNLVKTLVAEAKNERLDSQVLADANSAIQE